MPRVPEFAPVQADTSVLVPARADTSAISPTTATIPGKQMQQAGLSMMDLGSTVQKAAIQILEDNNAAQAKVEEAAATFAFNDLLNHPESGFLGALGKNAIDKRQAAIDAAMKIRDDTLSRIDNISVRRATDAAILPRLERTIDNINAHSLQQSRVYQVKASEARIGAAIEAAASDRESIHYTALMGNTIRQEVDTQGDILGWDNDMRDHQFRNYADAAVKARYQSWRMQDPVGALNDFMGAGQVLVNPSLRLQLGHQLFEAAEPVLADQINRKGGASFVVTGDGQPEFYSRGLRNNNPGNIVKGTSIWEGQVQGSDGRFASFVSPEAGIRAMGKVLLNYQETHGINTVADIVARWAPASENDPTAYTAAVSRITGIKSDVPINLRDQPTLAKVAKAIIEVENGPTNASKITDNQLATGLSSALNDTPLPATPAPSFRNAASDPSVPTGNALVDSLPADWKLRVLRTAEAQQHQAMLNARDSLRGRVQDATAAYMATGTAPNPPGMSEFVTAYGQAEGVARYREFQDVATLGQTLQQVKTLPASALENLIAAAKPVPGDGFAARQHNYEILLRSVDQVQTARARDPVAYALETQSYGIKPIASVNDSTQFADELAKRAAAAPAMAADYHVSPQLLTKDEAKGISASIQAKPVEEQKTYLAAIYKGVKDMSLFKQVMQQIAPDNPTAAVAGIYQANGYRTTQDRDVADLILRGQAILTPNSKEDGKSHEGGRSLIKMPEARLLLSEFNNATGDAFKGKENAADLFMQTAKAIYAARSAEEGDYSGALDSKRWKAAINLATGGIESHNGSRIVMPYGLGYDQFQNALKAHVERIVNAGAAFNTTAQEMMRLPLENIGDGRYLFRRGTGYLANKDGRPVVVDLNGGRR